MEVAVRIEGLDGAMKAMLDAFPADPKVQRQVLNGAMRRSALQTIVMDAKQRALAGDGSGALSESIGVRAKGLRRLRTSRAVAGVEVAPIRGNLKAMQMYISHYYTAQGRTPKPGMLLSGIRHGHLIEFGTFRTAARPFLWPAASSQLSPYMQRIAAEMRRDIERRVKRTRTVTGRLGR